MFPALASGVYPARYPRTGGCIAGWALCCSLLFALVMIAPAEVLATSLYDALKRTKYAPADSLSEMPPSEGIGSSLKQALNEVMAHNWRAAVVHANAAGYELVETRVSGRAYAVFRSLLCVAASTIPNRNEARGLASSVRTENLAPLTCSGSASRTRIALVIGFVCGKIPKLPLNLALVKNVTVHGVYWGAHATREPRSAPDLPRESESRSWIVGRTVDPPKRDSVPIQCLRLIRVLSRVVWLRFPLLNS